MKAISIKQPYASLIAYGIKDIENRTWKTNFRGRIYIHASGKSAGDIRNILIQEQEMLLPNYAYLAENYPTSAIIGEVDIVDCVINHPSIWAEITAGVAYNPSGFPDGLPTCMGTGIDGCIYNWVLANAVLYDEPILNVKGKLSFWDYGS